MSALDIFMEVTFVITYFWQTFLQFPKKKFLGREETQPPTSQMLNYKKNSAIYILGGLRTSLHTVSVRITSFIYPFSPPFPL